MGNAFMGQISITTFNFAPRGWALCNGQLLLINQNLAMFSLLGTQYGGNGSTTFALPDLRGRVPLDTDPSYKQGLPVGTPTVTLTRDQLPTHFHYARGSGRNADSALPATRVLGGGAVNLYRTADNLTPLHPQTLMDIGGNQPHQNMQPYLVLQFIICLQGIFPSKN